MEFPWGILIALAVLGLALLIKHFVYEVIEDDNHFWGVLFFYLLIYTISAFGITIVTPKFSAVASNGTAEEAVALDDLDPVEQTNPIAAFIEKIKIKNVLP